MGGTKGRPAGKPGASSSRRTQRRKVLAAAAIAGKPIAQVARQHGISRSWASQEANAPETKLFIAQLLDRHQQRIERLVDRSLAAAEDAFDAITDWGAPDHKVRLLAMKRVIEIALAGRKSDAEHSGPAPITYATFLSLYQEVHR